MLTVRLLVKKKVPSEYLQTTLHSHVIVNLQDKLGTELTPIIKLVSLKKHQQSYINLLDAGETNGTEQYPHLKKKTIDSQENMKDAKMLLRFVTRLQNLKDTRLLHYRMEAGALVVRLPFLHMTSMERKVIVVMVKVVVGPMMSTKLYSNANTRTRAQGVPGGSQMGTAPEDGSLG